MRVHGSAAVTRVHLGTVRPRPVATGVPRLNSWQIAADATGVRANRRLPPELLRQRQAALLEQARATATALAHWPHWRWGTLTRQVHSLRILVLSLPEAAAVPRRASQYRAWGQLRGQTKAQWREAWLHHVTQWLASRTPEAAPQRG